MGFYSFFPFSTYSSILNVLFTWLLVALCQYLNSHPVLYKAIVGVEESPDILTTEEARRAAKTLRMDFERGGIHLPSGRLSLL